MQTLLQEKLRASTSKLGAKLDPFELKSELFSYVRFRALLGGVCHGERGGDSECCRLLLLVLHNAIVVSPTRRAYLGAPPPTRKFPRNQVTILHSCCCNDAARRGQASAGD